MKAMDRSRHTDKQTLSRRRFIKSGMLLAGVTLVDSISALPDGMPAIQAAPKRIYLAPDDHTDYYWSADGEAYRQAFLEMLDYYLDLADSTASEAPEHQSRWNCDGSFWIWTYEKNKPEASFQRLIDRIKDGHISAPLNALVVCLGGAPAEAVLRGFYYAGQIERRYDLRLQIAVAMENQTLPYGLGALWAGSGAQYSWKGICGCASKIANAGDREHDIYWMLGPDGSRVLMKWNSLLSDNQSMGGYAEARNPSAIVDYVDTNSTFKARYPYDVIGAFGQGWDDLKTLNDAAIQAAKTKTTATRKVIVSNQIDFFKDFEASYGASLPTVSCSYGNEWDVYCTSMAEVSARVKRAIERLRGAEALATLVSLQDPHFMDSRKAARDQAWMALGLYWEHDWASGNLSIDVRAAWQREITSQIESYVDLLQVDATAALAALIENGGATTRFYAFNPLGWTRTDLADLPFADMTPVHVVDLSTGQETASQIVTVDGQRRLRILAQDVPPVGYKVFEIRIGAGATFDDAATVSAGNTIVENEHYQITLADRGAITSLVDKQRGTREFTQAIGGRAINDLGPGSGTLSIENAGPVSVTLVAAASGTLEHTTRITLIRGSRRIDIRNDISQNFGDTYTWGFGFALDNPDVWHEEVGAVIRARLLADGGHYSARNARYDWLTLNHFADISGGGVGVTLANTDCYFFQLGASSPNALDTTTPQINVLVGGQVDGPGLGIPDQGGDTHFMQRFALQTHTGYDALAAMRFALEHQNPLVTALITGGNTYPETSFSFLTVSDPRVLLWALKPADDGIGQAGMVARLWNLSDGDLDCSLSLPWGDITVAKQTTHIETPLADASVADGALAASLAARQIQTFAFQAEQASDGNRPIFVPLVQKS